MNNSNKQNLDNAVSLTTSTVKDMVNTTMFKKPPIPARSTANKRQDKIPSLQAIGAGVGRQYDMVQIPRPPNYVVHEVTVNDIDVPVNPGQHIRYQTTVLEAVTGVNFVTVKGSSFYSNGYCYRHLVNLQTDRQAVLQLGAFPKFEDLYRFLCDNNMADAQYTGRLINAIHDFSNIYYNFILSPSGKRIGIHIHLDDRGHSFKEDQIVLISQHGPLYVGGNKHSNERVELRQDYCIDCSSFTTKSSNVHDSFVDAMRQGKQDSPSNSSFETWSISKKVNWVALMGMKYDLAVALVISGEPGANLHDRSLHLMSKTIKTKFLTDNAIIGSAKEFGLVYMQPAYRKRFMETYFTTEIASSVVGAIKPFTFEFDVDVTAHTMLRCHAMQPVITSFDESRFAETSNKILCNDCQCLVNPVGHKERCRVSTTQTRDYEPWSADRKLAWIGDACHYYDVAVATLLQRIPGVEFNSNVIKYTTNLAQHQYLISMGLATDGQTHANGTKFEQLYTTRDFREGYLSRVFPREAKAVYGTFVPLYFNKNPSTS